VKYLYTKNSITKFAIQFALHAAIVVEEDLCLKGVDFQELFCFSFWVT
jgi:hypothetical protein